MRRSGMGNAVRLMQGHVFVGAGRVAQSMARCRRGVVALEYALLAGLVATAVTVGAGKLGSALNRQFTDLAAQLKY